MIFLLIMFITRGEYSCTASTSLDSVTSVTQLEVLSEPPKITSLPSHLGEVTMMMMMMMMMMTMAMAMMKMIVVNLPHSRHKW